MEIKPCQQYHSKVIARELYKGPGGSAFKVYFVSLTGRAAPERNDWAFSPLKREQFLAGLAKLAPEGVGFVTAFVPITKVFRYAPAGETIMHVSAFKSDDLSPLDLKRPDGYLEFACYAEAAIAADEYRSWADAASVEDYLKHFSPFEGGGIADNAKLAAYVSRQ